jgi:hypothetical protein
MQLFCKCYEHSELNGAKNAYGNFVYFGTDYAFPILLHLFKNKP